MNSKYYPEFNDLLEHGEYAPSISLIMPFNTRYGINAEIKHKLKALLESFQPEAGHLGLALFLSPVFEKIVYLDFEPEEKLVIDQNFELRDLVYNKNIVNKLVLLLLSGNEIRYYLYDQGSLTKLHSTVSDRIEAYMSNTLHDVAIYYEKSDRKEKAMEVFMKYAYEGLHEIGQKYPYPVAVTGSEKLQSHFKSHVNAGDQIVEYIEGNYLEAAPAECVDLAQKVIKNMQTRREDALLLQLEEALNKNQLAIGITEAWKQVAQLNGRLLVVEKNYRRLAGHAPEEDKIFTWAADKLIFPIQDAVDDIIEKLILHGGKVEFVEDGRLGRYRRCALITYFSMS